MAVRVVELFAGVGGFRIGLEGPPGDKDGKFTVVYANQWEPSTKRQHAAEIYVNRWHFVQHASKPNFYVNPENVNDTFENEDISKVEASEIPNHDLLVGGFPCQDYSVAKTLDKSKGLQGKKGVLWWEIYRIIEGKSPNHILLENVDRLIKSPSKQRGRDFAIMLSCFSELGYAVEWRVINAADYGMPQKRRRVFILAHKKGTKQYLNMELASKNPISWITLDGGIAKHFPVKKHSQIAITEHTLLSDGEEISHLSSNFNISGLPGNVSPFQNSGIMFENKYWTMKTSPNYTGIKQNLETILQPSSSIPDEYILSLESVTRPKGWIYQKGAKKELRTRSDGFTYNYSEGRMNFPDDLNDASRTIITGEGGSSASRFKHVVEFTPTKIQISKFNLNSEKHLSVKSNLKIGKSKWIRRLTPIELERLNQFPDNHTFADGISDTKRAFLMGNALVTGIISKLREIFL